MASSPVPSVAPVTPPSIHSLVTIKLSSENYLLWKAQIMPYLRGQRLFGYVDGSCLQPSQHIPNPEADKSPTAPRLLLNPEFSHWFDQDQIVLSILMSSLSESILAKVIGVTTSREVWCALEKMYSSHSRARLSTTRRQLSTVTKGGMSISDYFQTVKSLADTLAAIGHPLPDTEIVSYLLGGLDSSYDPIVTSIQTREDPIELEDIFGHLLTFELRLQQHTQVLEATIGSANVATRTDYSRGPHGKTQYSNRASSYSGSRGRAQQAPADTNWYPDTGSTNHLTNDLQNLNLHAETYAGSDQIQVGDGAEVFDYFKDEMGSFKASFCEDTRGMLYLYEASYLLVNGESNLELAREFTTKHLNENLEQDMEHNLAILVHHAMELPLHWRMLRLEARWFIDIYERRLHMNPVLLELAKLDFNIVQITHQNDLKYTTRYELPMFYCDITEHV
ncbi:hypothetical protein F0562_028877 [Nyssa sinensis]|uniref:Retrotransposon Copia-like N-terminal domain-containing protein n=1 Tax=Nyssa sinensis TaxID=561372 RepID=A0A5J5B131_9ASTE|nr:hypothetical protein F0562_028877 [Nyssa sinensis]